MYSPISGKYVVKMTSRESLSRLIEGSRMKRTIEMYFPPNIKVFSGDYTNTGTIDMTVKYNGQQKKEFGNGF